MCEITHERGCAGGRRRGNLAVSALVDAVCEITHMLREGAGCDDVLLRGRAVGRPLGLKKNRPRAGLSLVSRRLGG